MKKKLFIRVSILFTKFPIGTECDENNLLDHQSPFHCIIYKKIEALYTQIREFTQVNLHKLWEKKWRIYLEEFIDTSFIQLVNYITNQTITETLKNVRVISGKKNDFTWIFFN